MSTPAASAASNDASVLPGAMRSAPLWPMRFSAGIQRTSMSCGCRRPARASGSSRRSAGTAGRPAVDRGRARLEAVARGLLHARSREADDPQRLVVGDLARGAPRVDLGVEAALALPQVADARDRALVEQRVADRPRRVVLAQPRQEAALVELGGEDVGAEPGDALVEARARRRHELEHGPVELHDRVAGGAQHEPRAARRAPPALAVAVDAPRAGHAQVRVDDAVALEAQEQVLAVGVDGLDRAPGQLLGPAVGPEAGVGRGQLVRDPAVQDRADPVRGVMDRVALGHRCARGYAAA